MKDLDAQNKTRLQKPIIAAFDFDGTITTRDSLTPFLFFCAGTAKTIKKLIKLLPSLIGFVVGIVSRQEVKEKILTTFFGGIPLSQVNSLGQAFAASPAIKNILRPDMIQKIQHHRRQGHRCILISASIETYLTPWGKLAGFTDVLCSRLETTSNGIVTGKLEGKNCWGAEKVNRLKNLIGENEDDYILYAYGDSKGDHDLLAMADYPTYR